MTSSDQANAASTDVALSVPQYRVVAAEISPFTQLVDAWVAGAFRGTRIERDPELMLIVRQAAEDLKRMLP